MNGLSYLFCTDYLSVWTAAGVRFVLGTFAMIAKFYKTLKKKKKSE